MKLDQDLFSNLRYNMNELLWLAELNSRIRCAFGDILYLKLKFNFRSSYPGGATQSTIGGTVQKAPSGNTALPLPRLYRGTS